MIAWLTCVGFGLGLFAPPADPPPADPPPADPPIEIRAPDAVQQEQAPAVGGDPSAPPPSPEARPSEGVHAVGSGPVTPLPPPPPPVPVSAIPRFDWRGVMWLSLRLTVTGPIAGSQPARPSVVSLGGALEGGWRINQIAGLGLGLARQPHEVIRQSGIDDVTIVRRGTMSVWDVAFIRLFAPVRGRVDPFIDVGGGMAFLEPAREGEPLEIGGTLRASVGFDAWVTKNLTLGVSGLYRAAFLGESIGHSIQGALEIAVHW